MNDAKINEQSLSLVITLDNYIAAQQKAPDIADRLGSNDIQKVVGKIAEEFSLEPSSLAYVLEYAVLEKDMAVYLPDLLKENLNVDQSMAVKAAKKAAEKLFPFFKNRLAEKEKYQEFWVDIPKARLSDIPKGREGKGGAPIAAPTAKADPTAPKSGFEKRMAAETEVEISQKQKEVAAATVKSPDEALSAGIKSIMTQANLTFINSNLQKRLETIISARLRDVRDETETKEMLMRGDKVGGLGLAPVQADKVLELLRGVFAEVSLVYKKDEEQKKQKFVREQIEREALRKSERERREREEREKLYTRITGVAPTIKTIKQPTAYSQQLTAGNQQRAITATVQQLQAPAAKPRVEEVKFTPRVTGPIEELGGMNLAEFRRMSKDPKMAVQKIKDKLELLGDEDYAKKIEGIKAWQESGINKLYLILLKESLMKGVAIDAIIEEKGKAGAETLTKDEFNAIMELNRDLRF